MTTFFINVLRFPVSISNKTRKKKTKRRKKDRKEGKKEGRKEGWKREKSGGAGEREKDKNDFLPIRPIIYIFQIILKFIWGS